MSLLEKSSLLLLTEMPIDFEFYNVHSVEEFKKQNSYKYFNYIEEFCILNYLEEPHGALDKIYVVQCADMKNANFYYL